MTLIETYMGHEIRKEDGRFKTYAPKRASFGGGFLYTGSYSSLSGARRWVERQEMAWKEMQGGAASNQDTRGES